MHSPKIDGGIWIAKLTAADETGARDIETFKQIEPDAFAYKLALAFAEHENADRYVLHNGHQSTGVEPPEYDADDFENIARDLAARILGLPTNDPTGEQQ